MFSITSQTSKFRFYDLIAGSITGTLAYLLGLSITTNTNYLNL